MIRRNEMTPLLCLIAVALTAGFGLSGCSDGDETPPPVEQEELFVLNEADSTLSIFQVPGLERHEDDIVMASKAPHHVHFDHAHVYYYVVSRTQGGYVHKYDANTNEHLATSTLAHYYTGVATSPDAQRVYVTDFGQDIRERTKMYILQAQDLAAVDSITCGSQPHYIEMTEDGSTVMVVNTGSDEITFYYPGVEEDNITTVKLDPDPDSAAELGEPVFEPYCIALADDDSLAYICCRKSKWAGEATIFVFDVPRRIAIDTLHLPYVKRSGGLGGNRLGLCQLVDDDRYLAVTSQDGNSLFLVNAATGDYQEAVVQHDVTFGVTATSGEDYLYVTANNRSAAPGWVYEFKRTGGALTVTDSVEVGMFPNGIHVKTGAHSHGH